MAVALELIAAFVISRKEVNRESRRMIRSKDSSIDRVRGNGLEHAKLVQIERKCKYCNHYLHETGPQRD